MAQHASWNEDNEETQRIPVLRAMIRLSERNKMRKRKRLGAQACKSCGGSGKDGKGRDCTACGGTGTATDWR